MFPPLRSFPAKMVASPVGRSSPNDLQNPVEGVQFRRLKFVFSEKGVDTQIVYSVDVVKELVERYPDSFFATVMTKNIDEDSPDEITLDFKQFQLSSFMYIMN